MTFLAKLDIIKVYKRVETMALEPIQTKTVREAVERMLGGDENARKQIQSWRDAGQPFTKEMVALADEIIAEQGLGDISPIVGIKLLPVQIQEARKKVKALKEGDRGARLWWAIMQKQADEGIEHSVQFLKARDQLLTPEEKVAAEAFMAGAVAPTTSTNTAPKSLAQLAAEMGVTTQTQVAAIPPAPNPFTAPLPPHVPVPQANHTVTSSAPMSGQLEMNRGEHVHVPDVAPAPQVKAGGNHFPSDEPRTNPSAPQAFRGTVTHVAEIVEPVFTASDVASAELQRIALYTKNIREAQKHMADMVDTITAMHTEILQAKADILSAIHGAPPVQLVVNGSVVSGSAYDVINPIPVIHPPTE
jgi:hypothetical protein